MQEKCVTVAKRCLQVSEIIADLPEEEKTKLGFSQNEFLLQCEFAGTKCNLRYLRF